MDDESSDTQSCSEASSIITSTPKVTSTDQLAINSQSSRTIRSFTFAEEHSMDHPQMLAQDEKNDIIEDHGNAMDGSGDQSTITPPNETSSSSRLPESTTLLAARESILTEDLTTAPHTNSQSVVVKRLQFAVKFLFVVLFLISIMGTMYLFGQMHMLRLEIDELRNAVNSDRNYPVAKPASTGVAVFRFGWSVLLFYLRQQWNKFTHLFSGLFLI